MALTLEDLDRRVTALEKAAEREKAIERAVAEIVSESEQRVRADMSDLRVEMKDLRAEMRAESQRLTERVSSSRFDRVMAALERRNKP
jgi:hypothetical protein